MRFTNIGCSQLKYSLLNFISIIKYMQKNGQIGEVVIVGGGPVGNLSAVLAGFMGAKTTVYQKRDSYTRQINLKIQLDLFKDISKKFQRIGRRPDSFFDDMHKLLVQKDGKILLCQLQKNLKAKAQQLGVKYVMGKQIKTFKQVEDLHQGTNPIILDCTGRNSFLRINQFGSDQQNMKIYNLHHALHINLDAIIPRQFDFRLIYSIITNTNDIQLGDIVMGKNKSEKAEEDKSKKAVHITIPLFVSQSLSKLFDQNYPNINRIPLRPFSAKKGDCIIQQDVENLLYSIFCPFLMENWQIDWKSVVVKKINITCGYAVGRSKDRYICLGDSAAHFAYFKSLNFGLKHAYQLMLRLSSYHGIKVNLPQFNEKKAIQWCKDSYPPLIIKQAKPGLAPSEYFIKTEAIIFSAMVFNVAYNSINKLDILPVFCQPKVARLFQEYVQDSKQETWQKYLDKFQKDRQLDIDLMIISNKNKKNGTEFISHLIWLDNLVPLKLADFINFATKGYTLDKKDFDYFAKVFKSLKNSLQDTQKFKVELKNCTVMTEGLISKQTPKQFTSFCNDIKKLSDNSTFNTQDLRKLVNSMNWQQKNYEYKKATIYIKTLKLLFQILNAQTAQKK